ncbi:unnamed protein product [Prunus armeniaca]
MGDSQQGKGKTPYNPWNSKESNMLLELMVDAANRGWRDSNEGGTVALSSFLALSNTLLDIHIREILGLCTKIGGLYYVDVFCLDMTNNVMHPSDSKQKQIWLWHRRLGYLDLHLSLLLLAFSVFPQTDDNSVQCSNTDSSLKLMVENLSIMTFRLTSNNMESSMK